MSEELTEHFKNVYERAERLEKDNQALRELIKEGFEATRYIPWEHSNDDLDAWTKKAKALVGEE